MSSPITVICNTDEFNDGIEQELYFEREMEIEDIIENIYHQNIESHIIEMDDYCYNVMNEILKGREGHYKNRLRDELMNRIQDDIMLYELNDKNIEIISKIIINEIYEDMEEHDYLYNFKFIPSHLNSYDSESDSDSDSSSDSSSDSDSDSDSDEVLSVHSYEDSDEDSDEDDKI